MDRIAAKHLIDACHEARHLIALLPSLPAELSSMRLKTLDAVLELSEREAQAVGADGRPESSHGVQVSVVAHELGTTTPGITRTLNELAARGDVRKYASANDGRVVLVEPTEQGRATHRIWVEEVDEHIADLLTGAGLTEDDVATTARTIRRAYQALSSADLQRWQETRIS